MSVSSTPEEAAASWHESHICGHFGASVRPGKCGACAVRVLLAALRDARRERDELDRYGRVTTEDEYFAALRKVERERDQAREALLLAIPELERLRDIIEGRHSAQLAAPHGQSSAGPRRALEHARAALGGAAEETG